MPSVYFFKYLAMKPPENEDEKLTKEEKAKKEKFKKSHKLKLFVPDTIIMNDGAPTWIYTDSQGYVCKLEKFNDQHILEKFKSSTNDENELLAVAKTPNIKGKRVEDNNLELLNKDGIDKHVYSKPTETIALQKFIKCRGPKAFICRTVWRRNKLPYVYILTNKANYNDSSKNQYSKFVIDSKNINSYSPFYSSSGKHLEETIYYLQSIVKFIENHSDLIFEELAADFLKYF